MTIIARISPDYAAADQLTPRDFQNLVAQGYQSVLNLRLSMEKGFLVNEDALVAEAGLEYRHLPISSTKPDPAGIAAALAEIEKLPKPILIHCAAGIRAAALVLVVLAIQENLSHNEVFQKAKELGVPPQQPILQQLFNRYLAVTPA